MSTAFAIRTIIELAAILFVIYGVLHEQKFIDFEDKIIKKIKRYVRKRHSDKNKIEKAEILYAEGNSRQMVTMLTRRVTTLQGVENNEVKGQDNGAL